MATVFKSPHPTILPCREGALTEITGNWARSDVELAGQEEISRWTVFRMNCWIFGNPDGPFDGVLQKKTLQKPVKSSEMSDSFHMIRIFSLIGLRVTRLAFKGSRNF
jgi:hypothetical protein